jgi:hypothetical protein
MPTGNEYRTKAQRLCSRANEETNFDLRIEFEHLAVEYMRLAELADQNALYEPATRLDAEGLKRPRVSVRQVPLSCSEHFACPVSWPPCRPRSPRRRSAAWGDIMQGTSATSLDQPRCTDCGGATRLLVNLSGVTGDSGYELWYCDACGLRERLGRPRPGAAALPRFGYRARAKRVRTRH